MKPHERDRLQSLFSSGGELRELSKEVRWDRLYAPLIIGAIPFLIFVVFSPTTFAIIALQGYMLTGILFSIIFLVEEKDNLKEPWLWKASCPIVLIHIVAIVLLFFWDRAYPELASKGLVSMAALWIVGLSEYGLALWIIELCRPATEDDVPTQ
jgi:4-amino-4-deoxy-L-arabinose transferase-like glycosyltransferase